MGENILLIEDDNILRDNTAEILRLANYDVITAENGIIGIDEAIKHKPDLIICDILMPVLDGYGVLQIILRNKELQKIPFIFMSAKTEHIEIRKGMDLGASDYITKPFEESELLSAIESRLKRRDLLDRFNENKIETVSKKIKLDEFYENFIKEEKFKYNRGVTIYCEDGNSNHIFYIIKGEIKTFKDNEDGKELITGIFKDRDFFGFTSFVENRPYNENAVAIKTTTLIKIKKREFLNLVKENPQLAIHFLDLLAENLDTVKDHLIHLAYDTVRKKIADTLLQLNKINENNNLIEISRSNLAKLNGIAKETLIRTLTEFKDEKIIETNRNSIKIIDFKKLTLIK